MGEKDNPGSTWPGVRRLGAGESHGESELQGATARAVYSPAQPSPHRRQLSTHTSWMRPTDWPQLHMASSWAPVSCHIALVLVPESRTANSSGKPKPPPAPDPVPQNTHCIEDVIKSPDCGANEAFERGLRPISAHALNSRRRLSLGPRRNGAIEQQ